MRFGLNRIIRTRNYFARCLLLAACMSGCATPPQRPAASSYGCMVAVRDSLPMDLPDKRAHCMAAGLIAQRCSRIEAYMASIGKEVRDAMGFGDPEWADWRADRAGLRCAKRVAAQALTDCCEAEGY